MGNARTHDEFIELLKEKNDNFEYIKILGKYEKAEEKIRWKCLKCGTEHDTKAITLTSNHFCSVCASRKLIQEKAKTFLERLSIANPNFEPLEEYKGSVVEIRYLCHKCNCTSYGKPTVMLRGGDCPICASRVRGNKRKKSDAQFIKELNKINPDIEVIGEYRGYHDDVKCRCKKCGISFETRADHLLEGQGCISCGSSKGEKRVESYLKDNDISYELQKRFADCVNIYTLAFDFYLPKYNMCIEYDGEQHFRPVTFGGCDIEKAKSNYEIVVKRDEIKNQYCKDNNIGLLRIPYTDFDNIEVILRENLS